MFQYQGSNSLANKHNGAIGIYFFFSLCSQTPKQVLGIVNQLSPARRRGQIGLVGKIVFEAHHSSSGELVA
jgi:hypothetical protein